MGEKPTYLKNKQKNQACFEGPLWLFSSPQQFPSPPVTSGRGVGIHTDIHTTVPGTAHSLYVLT